MKTWHIVENDIIIDSLIADPKEQVYTVYPGKEIVEDDGFIGIGWIRTGDSWRAPEPIDDKIWEWNEELKRWEFVPSPEEESIVEE